MPQDGRADALRWTLRVTRHDEDGVTRLAVSGRLGAATVARLEECLAQVRAEVGAGAPTRIDLDLGGVDYISSAGLAVLEHATVQFREAGHALVLCGLQEVVQMALHVAGAAARLTVGDGRCAPRSVEVGGT